MFELSDLGFTAFFEAQMKTWPLENLRPARIASDNRDNFEVWSEGGAGFARLSGRLRRNGNDTSRPTAGDWVALKSDSEPDHTSIIEHVFERRTAFTRGAAGQESRGQVIAANVDLVFVVCGLDADYNAHRIDRYLARVWASGAQPVIVLNKTDVCVNVAVRVAQTEARNPGVDVVTASAVRAEGLDEIRAKLLREQTAALVGSSGVGKSTLINALIGEERLATAEVRADDSRGRHTTTRRQLVMLPGGGLLLDTPGMRELQLPDEEGLAEAFADIEALAGGCHFRDCRHDNEPGCAVKAAVAAGELPAERWEHYRKLQREARAYEIRHDVHLRRQTARLWKGLTREGEEIRRRKEGR